MRTPRRRALSGLSERTRTARSRRSEAKSLAELVALIRDGTRMCDADFVERVLNGVFDVLEHNRNPGELHGMRVGGYWWHGSDA